MRLKILLAFVFLFSFCIGIMNAQGPGFMGKHFYVKYDLGISALILDLPPFETLPGSKIKHSFSANYIIGKYFSPGISLSRYTINARESFRNRDIVEFPVSETSLFLKMHVVRHNIAPIGCLLYTSDAADE